jgi:hypothetical protein
MLIVIAEKEELKLVEELGYGNYPVLITGVGGVNVITALKDLPKDSEIMNIGYCGSEVFEIGKKLEIIAVKTHHEIADFDEYFMKLNPICKGVDDMAFCYTSTDFVTKVKKQEKDGFWSDCVYDMELAFIRAMFDNVKAIKVVSDNLNKKEYEKNVKK